jgi:predicted HD phosphohydrolase
MSTLHKCPQKCHTSRSRFFDEMDEYFIEPDRTSFGHMSEEEVVDYKKQAFDDLWKLLD